MNVDNNIVSIMILGNVDYIYLTDLVMYSNPKTPSEVI